MKYEIITKVFDWARKDQSKLIEQLGEEDDFSGVLSVRTLDKYENELYRMFKYIEENFEKKTGSSILNRKKKCFYEYAEEKIKEYHSGNTAVAYHLRVLDDAMEVFNRFGLESKLLQYRVKFPKKEKWSEKLKRDKVFRKSSDTSIEAATEDDILTVCKYLKEKASSKASVVAADVLWLAFITGFRISSITKLQVKYFDETTGILTSPEIKNHRLQLSGEDKEFLARLIRNSDGSMKNMEDLIFKVFYKKGENEGEIKKFNDARKSFSSKISYISTKLLGDGEINNAVTLQGARKAFAKKYAKSLIDNYTYTDLQNELIKLMEINEKHKEMVEKAIIHIKFKFTDKESAEKRTFTYKELIEMLTSLQLGISRNEVSRYYITKDFWKNQYI